jgi:SAM-dependent methyltransferase
MGDALKHGVRHLSIVPPSAAPEKMPQRTLASRLAGRVLREIRTMFGLSSFLRNEDRRVLEQIIFPHFLNDRKYRDVLFVGCDWYTAGYNAWFEEKNYWTIESDPKLRKFGAKQHIVDSLQNLPRHFPAGTLDLIVCNGVFGWGLDAATDVEKAVAACYDALREGGILLVGIDGVEERRPYALETSDALRAFAPYTFPPLDTADYLTDTPYRHRFLFFRKPHAEGNPRPAPAPTADAPANKATPTNAGKPRRWLQNQDWSLGSGNQLFSRIMLLAIAELKHLVGIESFLMNEDRHILEEVIFPYFLHDDVYMTVLFVGCSWCTRGYNKLFERRKNYWTIDRALWKRRYGARQHIAAPLQHLTRYFRPGDIDLIVCNGVYGWGLNEHAEIEAAFTACYECLREDGVLIIGWDDVAHLNPCPLSTWQCLQDFRPFVFPPLHTAEFVTATAHRHVYSFFRRPHAAERADHHERDRA